MPKTKAPVNAENNTKEFCVAAISDNANSFGLRGHVLVARDGEAMQVGRSISSSAGQLLVSDVVRLGRLNKAGGYDIAGAGFELADTLKPCPAKVVAEIWKAAEAKQFGLSGKSNGSQSLGREGGIGKV